MDRYDSLVGMLKAIKKAKIKKKRFKLTTNRMPNIYKEARRIYYGEITLKQGSDAKLLFIIAAPHDGFGPIIKAYKIDKSFVDRKEYGFAEVIEKYWDYIPDDIKTVMIFHMDIITKLR